MRMGARMAGRPQEGALPPSPQAATPPEYFGNNESRGRGC